MHHPSLRNRHLPTRILSAQYHPTEASPAPLSPSEHMQIDSSDDPEFITKSCLPPVTESHNTNTMAGKGKP